MTEEEKKAIERLSIKATTSSIKAISYPNAIVMKKDIKTVLNLIDKQQKEIEELKKENIELSNQITDGYWENDRLKNEIEQLNEIKQQICNEELITQDYVQENFIKKDKIKEILGIEEDMTEEQFLSYIDILVSENNRLEDIEDRKVEVAVDNIEKKRDKYWGDKIREILKNYLFTEGEGLKDFYQDIFELVREIDKNNEDLFTLGELEYAISHSEEFDFGGFNQETIKEAVKTIKKLDKIIQSFESGEMITGVKNV